MIILFTTLSILWSFSPNSITTFIPMDLVSETEVLFQHTPLEEEVLLILESKCNQCHRMENKGSIFTLENMNQNAKKIHKQVFVKQKMPKGDIITLTDEERSKLLQWLEKELEIN